MVFTLAALLAAAPPVEGQTAYSLANGQTSIQPLHHGFLSVDFAEAKFALTLIESLDLGCSPDGCEPNQLDLSLFASAAARKRQQSVFTKLDFNPGFDIGGRVAYVAQRDGMGHDALYLGVRYTTHERDIITMDIATGINTLGFETQQTLAASVGFNHAFTDATIVGVGFEGRRELSSPEPRLAEEFCTPGTAPTGQRVLVCANRFLAPLSDLWNAHARFDFTLKLATLGRAADAARLGLSTAASMDLIEGAGNPVNFSLGPTVHLAGFSGHAVAAFFVGLVDVFDANGLRPDFGDRFVIQLMVGAPFSVLAGR
ncbi:MAG: hypothetical protein O7I93_12270 [Gemmatimonadetes bacterium]|nr:hypothetical protein [Gemmatimonadota bacterium]